MGVRFPGVTQSSLLFHDLSRGRAVDPMVLHGAHVYASGEETGRGCRSSGRVTVLTWRGEPEAGRREAARRRLLGLQD